MKKWIPWLLAVGLMAIVGAASPSISGGGGCTACVLKSGDTMSGALQSSVASGSNAIKLNNNGARIDLGTGANDYLFSDGTAVRAAGDLVALGDFYVGSALGASIGGASSTFTSSASIGVNAFRIITDGALFDLGPGTQDYLSASANIVILGDGLSSSFASGIMSSHGLTIHDTGIGAGGGLHLTQGDDATAFIPFLRPTVDNLPMVFGGGRTPDGATFNPVAYNLTTGYNPEFQIIESVAPASGNGTFSSLEINATLNGASSGTYAGLVVDPIVTAFTGGTVLLADFGTTSSTYTSGYTSAFKVDSSGNTTATGFISAGSTYRFGSQIFMSRGLITANDVVIRGNVTDGASAQGMAIGNGQALSTAGAKIIGFYSDAFATRVASIDKDGYIASATPSMLSSVYVNSVWVNSAGTANFQVYHRQVLPARAFTVSSIDFGIRTPGSGGSTNATFEITDGTNNCGCAFACNSAEGPYRTACTGTAGTGCAFAASANLVYRFNGAGNCTTNSDILGNIMVEGNWK